MALRNTTVLFRYPPFLVELAPRMPHYLYLLHTLPLADSRGGAHSDSHPDCPHLRFRLEDELTES